MNPLSLDAALPHELRADPKLMRIIFQNPYSNAFKYTGASGCIEVAIQVKQPDFLIGVKDNGMRIPIDEQSKMFTKLYRANNAQKSTTEGTGLGLYIVKAVIEDGGDRIWFDSQEGKGLYFMLQFHYRAWLKLQGQRA